MSTDPRNSQVVTGETQIRKCEQSVEGRRCKVWCVMETFPRNRCPESPVPRTKSISCGGKSHGVGFRRRHILATAGPLWVYCIRGAGRIWHHYKWLHDSFVPSSVTPSFRISVYRNPSWFVADAQPLNVLRNEETERSRNHPKWTQF